MGTVPFRAPVGDRARGLLGGRPGLELLHPRPGALTCLPLGGGRPGRLLRRPAAALLRARALERQGRHPEGAGLRPRQLRGEPRRGREGVLLLSRLHADPLVHEVALQVPAVGVSVPRPRPDQPEPDPQRSRVRAPRHGCVRRRPLLRRPGRVREGDARGHPDPGDRHQPRKGGGAAPRPPHPLVPEHVELGRRRAPAAPRLRPDPAGRLDDRRDARGARAALALLRREPRAPVHGERDQQRAGLRGQKRQPLRERCLRRLRRSRKARRREPGAHRDQGRCPVRPGRAGGWKRGAAAQAHRRRAPR